MALSLLYEEPFSHTIELWEGGKEKITFKFSRLHSFTYLRVTIVTFNNKEKRKMKNHASHDTRRSRQQRQFDRDRNLDGSHSQQQRLELRERYPELQHQPNVLPDVLHDVDPDAAEWAAYCNECWLP